MSHPIFLPAQDQVIVIVPPSEMPIENIVAIVASALPGCSIALMSLSVVSTPPSGSKPTPPALSGREQEVFVRLSQGYNTPSIASDLHVSTSTIRNHIKHIATKLGLPGKKEVCAYARKKMGQ
jgi:DNA-binding NarL/FixJ family response regulator